MRQRLRASDMLSKKIKKKTTRNRVLQGTAIPAGSILSITIREHTSISVHVVQKIKVIGYVPKKSQKIRFKIWKKSAP